MKIIAANEVGGSLTTCKNGSRQPPLRPLRCRLRAARRDKEPISYVVGRPDHYLRDASDASKIQRELSWHLRAPFNNGLRKTVNGAMPDRDWCRHARGSSYPRERLGKSV